MKRRALIGHTGFVGGNLLAQASFDDLFNSTNIEEIAGRSYSTIVCAGAPGAKWRANKEPEVDRAAVARLTASLGQASADRVILISTIDVYPNPVAVDETAPLDPAACHAYGAHRLELERFVTSAFETTTIRLPGLFGPGLKKNIVFDLLHGNAADQIRADSLFQFYGVTRLWQDIETVLAAGVPLLNFATEPMTAADMAREVFNLELGGGASVAPARYDFRTQYARLWGRDGGYIALRHEVLDALRAFVHAERARFE